MSSGLHRRDLRSDTPAENAAHKKPDSQQKEYGFAIGGPIIQDRLHFFLAYEAKNFVTPVAVIPDGTLGFGRVLPAERAGKLRPDQSSVQRRSLVRQSRLGAFRRDLIDSVGEVSRRDVGQPA